MFKHILVPLDESACAEQALPMAAHIARTTGATLTLLRVLSYSTDYLAYSLAPGAFVQDAININEDDAKNYFSRICADPRLKDIEVKTATMYGTAPQAIIENAELKHADLIVMCSHGRTGLKRLVLGSVAQQVARDSSIPVLILHARQDKQVTEENEPQPFRILIALDGSSHAETAIRPAAELSSILSSPNAGNLHLIRIVKPIVSLNAMDSRTIAKANRDAYEQAEKYLEGLTRRIFLTIAPEIPLDINFTVRCDEEIADRLISVANVANLMEVPPLSAIAVATHGRHDIPRWILGSVTEDILSQTTLPVLVLKHVEDKGDKGKALTEAATKKPVSLETYHPFISL